MTPALRIGITAVLIALAPAPPAAAEDAHLQSDERPFDPLAGMEPNGLIPAVERPPDLERPGRWRYIPEGRLKPGNFFQRFLVTSFAVPLVFRDSDVGTGGGVAITDIDFRSQRRREFAGIFLTYTSEGQQNYSLAWRRWIHHLEREEGGVFQEERSFWRVTAGYQKTLTRRFFGLGSNTNDDDESSYTDEVFRASAGLELSLPNPGSDWVGEARIEFESHELSRGRVSGKPDTRDAFPALFDDAEHSDLGWLVAGLRYDTRDSQRNPYSGGAVGAKVDALLVRDLGSDPGARFTLDGSYVVPVPGLFHSGGVGTSEEHPPTDVVAFGAALEQSTGSLPFFERPALGGSNTQRGYITGRWYGDSAWHAALEYRFWVIPRGFSITRAIRIERIGLAPFYEAGAVAGHLKALTQAEVRHTLGGGLRILLERAAPFRVDVGWSAEGIEVSASFGLPF